MSRVQRADNVGMHLTHAPQRPYGNCPSCQRLKPIYWTSRINFLCYRCLKKSGLRQFIPPVGTRNQDLLDSIPHRERPLRARPLRQQQPQPRKPVPPRQKKRQPPQQSPVNAKTMKDERSIPPDPEVQALWDQRRASMERRAEQLRREQERQALEQRLAQDRRHR